MATIELTDKEREDLKAALSLATNVKLQGMSEHFNLYTEDDKAEAKRQLESWRVIRLKLQ